MLVSSLLFGLFVNGQTVLYYDNMETYNWMGAWWNPNGNSGYYSNASVSSNLSAAMYGLGTGSSAIEQNWYVMPNVTGLDPSGTYTFNFRLGSYRFSSTATSRGVDGADYVEVQVSTDGGFSYVSEIRVRGNNNAYWDYNNNGVINAFSDGILDIYQVGNTGNQTSTGLGYSVISLTLPFGTTQVAVDIYCRSNAAGEEWWLDDIQLIETLPIALPVEFISFEGLHKGGVNFLEWKTGSEYNSAYFSLERSVDGINWKEIAVVGAAGNSDGVNDYFFEDYDFEDAINYYRLVQIDNDGTENWFDYIVSIDNEQDVYVVRRVNLLGQEVSDFSNGLFIEILSDGSIKKIMYEIK